MSYKAKPIFFMEPLNSTPEIRRAMKSFLQEWLPRHSFSEELPLYHYTTIQDLKGILSSRSIWCSHISTLNDPSELHYGRDFVQSKLKEAIEQERDDRIRSFLNDLAMYTSSYDRSLFHTYVACFCEFDNLLSQWRGYSDPDGGYNLGFTFSSDTKFSHDPSRLSDHSHVILRKVIYDEQIRNEVVSEYITAITDAARSALERMSTEDGSVPREWATQAAMESVNILLDMILTLKNPAFHEEREWRLINAMRGNHKPELLRFREGKNSLIPFLPTYIFNEVTGTREFPLDSIRFGPMLDEAQARPMLDLLVHNSSSIGFEITINPTSVNIRGPGYRIRS